MRVEPEIKRVIAFFDGQNLYHSAKEAFGHFYPKYDPAALAKRICTIEGWKIDKVHFYTGIPDENDDFFWHHFWKAKLASMGKCGIQTYSRPLRYRFQTVKLPDGGGATILVGQEKGIDIRIALDIVRMARLNIYDIALIFSQDQDLSEVADEVRSISRDQDRWIKIVSAFPISPAFKNQRGINGTDWIKFVKSTYDECLDSGDYRPKRRMPPTGKS